MLHKRVRRGRSPNFNILTVVAARHINVNEILHIDEQIQVGWTDRHSWLKWKTFHYGHMKNEKVGLL
jgi:hypothetical protein